MTPVLITETSSTERRGGKLRIVRLACVLLAGTALLGASTPSGEQFDSPGAIAMEARIRAIFQGTDWKADPNKPAQRAAYFADLLQRAKLTQEQKLLVANETCDGATTCR